MSRYSTWMLVSLAVTGVASGCAGNAPTPEQGASTAGPPPAHPATPAANHKRTCARFGDALRPDHVAADGFPRWDEPPPIRIRSTDDLALHVTTSHGTMVVALDAANAPIAVNNLVFLACAGFYDGQQVNRTQPDQLLQFGDPSGTLTGGPGYRIPDEPVVGQYERGTVGLARDPGSDGAGSQMFILVHAADFPRRYQIVGKLSEGIEIADSISQIVPGMGPSNLPVHPRDPIEIAAVAVTQR